jgi:hypothetical protein
MDVWVEWVRGVCWVGGVGVWVVWVGLWVGWVQVEWVYWVGVWVWVWCVRWLGECVGCGLVGV